MKGERVEIIAEAGVNHNGSLDMALKLVDVAVDAGVDAVKFQTFSAAKLASRKASLIEYQKRTESDITNQQEMLKKLEISEQDHYRLIEHCKKCNIEFLSTPFNTDSAIFLTQELGLKRIKISSGEITNAPLLLVVAKAGSQVILSTGMSDLAEISRGLGVLAFGLTGQKGKPDQRKFQQAYESDAGRSMLHRKVTLLHCTSEYPAPFEAINLRAIDTLEKHFGLPVGLSDHSSGIAISVAAVARGASVVEKHFTLDKTLQGPDHSSSLEPDELKALVRDVRSVELALGDGVKEPTLQELENRKLCRQSLTAVAKISKGDHFTAANLATKRPGTGISPIEYWQWLGEKAEKDFDEDEQL